MCAGLRFWVVVLCLAGSPAMAQKQAVQGTASVTVQNSYLSAEMGEKGFVLSGQAHTDVRVSGVQGGIDGGGDVVVSSLRLAALTKALKNGDSTLWVEY